MTRYQFLKSLGFSGGALLALVSCLNEEDSFVQALVKNPDGTFTRPDGTIIGGEVIGGPDKSFQISTEELEKINFLYKVNINSPLYSKLFIRTNFVVLANTFVLALSSKGKFIAATVVCSHEQNRTVSYKNGEWYCPVHGARYNLDGKGLNENGKRGIQVYNTAFDGETILIYA